MHALLKRQLRRHAPHSGESRAEWAAFIAAVDDAYEQHEVDRGMLERSMELSSEELLQTNSELLAVFRALPDLFMRTDHSGVILERHGGDESDPFASRAAGLIGKKIQDIPIKAVATHFRNALQRVRATSSLVAIEYRLPCGDVERSYEARLLPLLDDQVMVIMRDISSRKQAQQALEAKAAELSRSNRELQEYAYVASHDLQEPLRTVQSYLQLLSRRHGGALDDEANEFIDYAVDGAKRMRELIRALLTYANVSSKAQPATEVDMNVIAQQVCAALGAAILETGAKISYGPLPVLSGDAAQLRQLLQNLVANALKFTRDRVPLIDISAERTGAKWTLAVRDNGIGMKASHLDRVFVIFKRLHSREEFAGTGIGLAICRKIVERHNGRIWVTSQPGEGSTFWIELPASLKESSA